MYSTHVIKMSIECFHSLADEIGEHSVPVVLLSNTGRCGSTMMSQVFESVEGTLVMAEPDAVQNVFYLLRYSGISEKEYRRLPKSTLRLLCKPRPGTERIYEPRCEKTGLRGFPPSPTQTGLYSHRRWLEA